MSTTLPRWEAMVSGSELIHCPRPVSSGAFWMMAGDSETDFCATGVIAVSLSISVSAATSGVLVGSAVGVGAGVEVASGVACGGSVGVTGPGSSPPHAAAAAIATASSSRARGASIFFMDVLRHWDFRTRLERGGWRYRERVLKAGRQGMGILHYVRAWYFARFRASHMSTHPPCRRRGGGGNMAFFSPSVSTWGAVTGPRISAAHTVLSGR